MREAVVVNKEQIVKSLDRMRKELDSLGRYEIAARKRSLLNVLKKRMTKFQVKKMAMASSCTSLKIRIILRTLSILAKTDGAMKNSPFQRTQVSDQLDAKSLMGRSS
ncbi:hypothetical protein FGO68_gene9327 [Halteria grandinella]|uniref:Uncharacterized protein n=1 Tax=Halteria grandinella TaxID=5974 RepID=A0A8J8SUE5_HALGN|nr:hypothetical protein FGO68_gene9327 [Halteria grandinella]